MQAIIRNRQFCIYISLFEQNCAGGTMYKNERELEILKILTREGYVTVRQLSRLLYTSESSIRRDLTSLEQQGMVVRSYGGVELAKNSSMVIPFSTRAHHNISQKKIIARKAAELVKDGDIIFLDQSSSAFFVANEIINKSNITVITNNIEIISFLSQYRVEVISSGGSLSRSNRNCLLGTDAHRIFAESHADILFFSTKSLSHEGIIYDYVREEICIRNTMLANAEKKVFLCDSTKFGSYAAYKQCTLEDVDCVISDKSREELGAMAAHSSFDNLLF